MSIVPANTDMAKKIAAVGLLNKFVAHGFEERKAFVQVVIDIYPDFNNLKGVNKLNNFWALREFSINDELEKVLETLKKE
ncbi:hypothetical protein [Myroides marinus]|uniref:hypothetical protein n=1 Tax=Myroides marinus TaxID=703342 RepID=UPI002576B938|nr:hypothetical protein [Myroides marinus]MDM1378798.1 hypothetical protein [Myroides marinus]MDM1386069.1 hypothetical protein [Myroides marinus]MDM1393282.1 hypothetical protein [Myroides marinus]